MSAGDPLFVLRKGWPQDERYIVELWANMHAKTKNGRGHGPNYPIEQRALVTRILRRPTTEVRVACEPSDLHAIMGFAVVEPRVKLPRVYWVFVRREAQRMGIATTLIAELALKQCVFTHHVVEPGFSVVSHRLGNRWSYSYFANFEDKPLGDIYQPGVGFSALNKEIGQ